MVKLLIIADDFTGALDTGIQFVNKGIATQVFTKMPEAIGDIDETTEVLVIDSETRPMPAAKAYDAVKNITGWAKAIKIPIIFKKTDSALRGNIGSELQAVLDGSRHDKVYFLPGVSEDRPLYGKRNSLHTGAASRKKCIRAGSV